MPRFMMRKGAAAPVSTRAFALFFAFLPALFLGASTGGESTNFWAGGDRAALLDSLVAGMDDAELLGQLFMFAYPGTDPGPEILGWIAERKIGGVKIFGWNADDTSVLAAGVAKLQRASQTTRLKVPLFIATDQEGGWIRHVKGKTSITPGNMAIGASGLPMDAYWSGYYISRELKALGINMNFAPTVDLFTERDSVIIGPRSFGDEPRAAGILGAAYYRGSRAAGVVCTAKHFPGHGDTALDSHGVLPVIRADRKTLDARELVPYRILAREGIPAVMSGHLNYPLVTGDGLPASMSPKFLKEILRSEIGFRGLVITDDLAMVGAGGGGVGESCIRALRAGNDIVMLSGAPGLYDPFWKLLLARMGAEPDFRAQVETSARRVLSVKLEYLRREDPVPLEPDPASLDRLLPDPGAAAFYLDQACRSATSLKEGGMPLPAEGRILLAGQFGEFFAAGKRFYPKADQFRFSYQPSGETLRGELDALFLKAGSYDAVVFCLANPASLELLQAIRLRAKKVVVLSVLNPAYAEAAPWISGGVAVYSFARESFVAGFAAIAGKIAAGGRLPYGGD